MKPPKRDFQREAWMAQYEEEITRNRPELHGKIDWDTATFFFNSRRNATVAAMQWLSNHPAEAQREMEGEQ